jgi:hypothetical protein
MGWGWMAGERRRARRPGTVAAAVAALTFALAVFGGAVAGAAPAGAAPGRAMVRVAHFAPDVSYVDIYVVSLNGTQLVPNVFYREVSSYWGVPSGAFTYEVRPAGSPRSGDPMVRLRGSLDAGSAYTVATVGQKGDLNGLLLPDDMRAAAPGTARARVVNAAVGLPPVDVDVTGTAVRFKDLAFSSQTAYRRLPAGRYKVAVRSQGGEGSVVASRALTVKPGTVSSVVLVGGAGKPRELLPLTDAVGTAKMPAGGVATGAGGTAPAEPTAAGAGRGWWPLLLPALGLTVLVAVRARRRTA